MSEINKELVVSETRLNAIVGTQFNPHSWYNFEKHTDIAIDIITDTLYNLYQKGFIDIKLNIEGYTIAQYTLFKKKRYYIELIKEPDFTKIIGWFEQEIILELRTRKRDKLPQLLYDLLFKIFEGDRYLNNPGKQFLLASLKKQNCNLYKHKTISHFFGIKIEVWQEPSQKKLLKELDEENNFDITNVQIHKVPIRKIVKKQLIQFESLGT